MKHITKILACLPLTMVAWGAQANSYMGTRTGECYLGANLQYLFAKTSTKYQGFLKQQEPGVDFYAGYRLNRALGLELGGSWTTRLVKNTSFIAGQTVLGSLVIDNPTNLSSKLRLRNTHLDMNGYYPLGNHLDGIVSVGVGFLTTKVNMTMNNPNSNLYNAISNITGRTSTMMRFGLGVEGMLGDYWGMRSMVRYENTGKARVKNIGVSNNKILKDGVSVAVGVYRYFD